MELNSFLTGIADAIRSKKGTTDKINASNFASEILSITGGGGASAVIKTLPSWQGTTVPNSGYVDNVYFNTALSVEEVNDLLNSITYLEGEMKTYSYISYWLSDTELVQGVIFNFGDGFVITNPNDFGSFLFNSSQSTFDAGMVDFLGWSTEFDGIININNNLLSHYDEINVGLQNAQLAHLFSTTPFVQASGESIGLSGEYDGSSIEVTEAGKIDIKALIDEKKIPLEVNVNVSGGGSSEETLIVLKYMIETVNMVLDASKVVFNNPDNIPIYKSVMTILDYETGEIAFGDLELYEGELTFWNEGNIIESNTIDEANGSVTYYFIKPKDLIGKQCPYITGITLTIDNENLTTTCAILPNNFSVVEIGGILLIDNSGRSYIYEAGTYNTTNHKIELSNHIMIKS